MRQAKRLALPFLLVIAAVALSLSSGAPQAEQRLPGARPRSVFAPYYSVGKGYRAMLGLNNTTRAPFVVHPTIYSVDGEGVQMPPIRLEAHEHKKVDLAEWVMPLGERFALGSLRLGYESVGFGLGSVLSMVNEDQSLVVDVKLQSPGEFKSSRLEGVWWRDSRESRMTLAVVNTTDETLTPRVIVTAEDGGEIKKQQVPLAPHQSRVLDLQFIMGRNLGAFGGISISHDGKPGAIMAHAFVVEPKNGLSVNLPFADPAKAGDSKLEGAGVLIGSVQQSLFAGRLLLRNASETRLKAAPVLQRGGGIHQIAEITLGPGESRELRVSPNALPNGGEPIGIQIFHGGESGDLIAQWFSVDASGSLVVETPLRSPAPNERIGGNHPWSIEGDTSSVLYVKNTGSEKGSFLGTIWHSQGQYMIGIKEVNAGETVSIDLRKLRDEQVPDVQGRRLPLDLTGGQIQWRWKQGPPLVGRLNVMNTSKAIASNMSCQTCCCTPRDVAIVIQPLFTAASPGENVNFQAWESDEGCDGFGLFYPISPNQVIWESSNENVARRTGPGEFFCLLPGIAGVRAFNWFETSKPCIDTPGCEPTLDVECDCRPSSVFAEAFADIYVSDLASFQIDVLNPVPETNSAISGQPFQVRVTAKDTFGFVFDRYRGTVHFTSGDSVATLPNDYTFTASDGGAHTFNVTLKTVAGTSPTRGLTVRDVQTNISTTKNIFVWFRVIATREGLVGGTTGCQHVIVPNDHFVALPVPLLCNVGVRLANGSIKRDEVKLDTGPWCPHSQATPGNPCVCPNDPYWNTTGVPLTQSLTCDANNAGIDLADGTFNDLGLTTNSLILWRFR